MKIPETRYARSGSLNIAYQVFGTGDQHVIFIPGWVSNIEEAWNIPQLAAWMKYIAGFTRLVVFDKRGTGLSDRVSESELPNQEQRIEDLEALINTLNINNAVLFGLSEGGSLALLFAGRFPKIVSKIVLFGSFAKWIKSADYPYGLTIEEHATIREYIFSNWGKPIGLHLMAPSEKDNKSAQDHWASFLRRSASPGTADTFYEMNIQVDVRSVLEQIQCPVLIIHRAGDKLIECDQSRYLHQHISTSQLIISEGQDHLPWYGWNSDELMAILSFIRDETAVVTSPETLTPEDLFTLFEVRDYLQNNLDEEISILSLCKKFGFNEYKLKNGFRTVFHTAPISFLTKQRMLSAKKMLTSPGETVSSVAEKCGYKHATNFSIAFKKEFGITPRTYQQNFK